MSNTLNMSNTAGEYQGLSSEEAQKHLSMYGFNTFSKLEEDGKGFRVAGIFLSLRFILMILNSVLLILNSELSLGIVLLCLTVVYVITEIFKGTYCDEWLHKMKQSINMKFRVVRDGEIILVRKERIVPDDIIVLQGGENVPADAHLLEVNDVFTDESFFTSDKAPIAKFTGSDNKNEMKQTCIYKGTRILSGNLTARVIATGIDTKYHKISIEKPREEVYYTSIENFINKIKPLFSVISLVLLIVIWLYNFFTAETSGDITPLEAMTVPFMTAFSFAICFLPSETSSIVRLYYIRGALKLTKSNNIIKDLTVLENLSAITAMCIDKTGVITKSRIELVEEHSKNPEMLTNISLLSCDVKPSSSFDQAIILCAAFKHIDIKELHQNELLKSFPFSEQNKIGGNLWSINGARLLCIKGSPENIFSICNLNPEQLYAMQKKQLHYSKRGHQVLAVAYVRINDDEPVPESIFAVTYNLAGLLAFTNQTRDSIPAAIRGCYRAGVKVIMMTGDGVDTAVAIGKKIGLKQGRVITGEQLKKAHDFGEKLDLNDVSIFARINPEQKLDIVRLLQEQGEIVGITGENVSDVDVLEQADIGITRSINATGAAYEACDLIINDDNFNIIVETLKESRQLHRNIKRAITISISFILALILFAVFNLFAGGEFLLTALPVSLLAIVVIPVCMMFFIDNRSDIKSTLNSSEFIKSGKMNKKIFIKSALHGTALFLAMLIIFLALPSENYSDIKRSCLIVGMTSGIISMAWVLLSENTIMIRLFNRRNDLPIIITGVLLLFLLFITYIPFIGPLFQMMPLEPLLLLLSITLGFISQLPFDLKKLSNKTEKENEVN